MLNPNTTELTEYDDWSEELNVHPTGRFANLNCRLPRVSYVNDESICCEYDCMMNMSFVGVVKK
jgi:hypothetical protein